MGNPIDFLRENIFYTPEKIQQINEAQRASAARSAPTEPKKPVTRPSVGGPLRGAGGMMSGRNPATTPSASEAGYMQGDRGALVKNPNYKPSRPVTREKYVDTVPEGYENPYVMKPGTQITGTAGASAMMSGGDPTNPVVSTYVPQRVDISQKTPSRNTGKMAYFGDGYKEQELKLAAEAEKSTPVPPTVRQESTRTNSNGVEQRGYKTTLSKEDGGNPYLEGEGGLFDRLGLGTDVQINRGWSSNQLHGTDTALYGGKPQSQELGEGNQSVILSKDLDQDGGAVRNLESMPQEAFADTQKGDGRPTLFKDARSRAFLDAPNSMAGMRAVDAQLGRVRSGNDFFYANPDQGQDGADEFIKVSLADGRQHQNDQISGQQLLNKYVDNLKGDSVGNPDAPAVTEFSPDMSEAQFKDFQDRGGSQLTLEDMEMEDFINYQN